MHPNLSPDFASRLLSPAGNHDDKYSRGVVGFVTGSDRYPGAALLGINAAYELQIGMVGYLGPESVTNFVLSNRPETLVAIDKAKVLVLGSGIADDEQGQQLVNLKHAVALGLPSVIDAGALQLLDLSAIKAPAVLTPHAGEAERLFRRLGHERKRKDIEGNPVASAWELAELTGQVVLLKGSISVLALRGFEPIESGPGSSFLSTAGTGDVLAGMIGALAARQLAKERQLSLQVFRDIALVANQLHSEAAEIAAARGEYGASAVCAAISDALA